MADADKEGVSYEMLQDLLRAERRSNKLTPVPARFWPDVRAFLLTVSDAFRLEQSKDPFSRRVMLLTDEVKNARHAAESIWALRERKLAMLALAARKDGKKPEGITPDEAMLYQRFLETLDAARLRVFDGTTPGAAAGPATATPAPGSGDAAPPAVQMPIAEPAPVAAAVASTPARPAEDAAPAPAPAGPVQVPHDTHGPAPEMVTIRALGDIPPFVGPDMQTYLLKTGDIATVPPSIANLLVRRQKAAILEV